MGLLLNNQLFDALRDFSTNFENITAEMTYENFKDAVLGGQSREEVRTMTNEFLGTAMQFWLNEVIAPDAKDVFEDQNFGRKYYHDFAGYMQNMYVTVGNPVSPAFKNPQNGKGADPFAVRKPVVEEVFYTFNFDYQNFTTIGMVQLKTAFASADGLSRLIAGQMKALASKFKEQVMALKEEALNAAINDENKPLKAHQVVSIQISDTPTKEELINFVAEVNNTVDAMTLKATGAFNRMGWKDVQDRKELAVLQRANFKNILKTQLLQSAFNKEDLNLSVDSVIVPSFGGLIPTADGTEGTKLSRKYDENGAFIGFYAASAPEVIIDEDEIQWIDPNEDVIAIVCDRGVIFELDQNPYTVEAAYNPRNMLTTYWANKPNGSVHYDPYRNFVVIKKAN